MKNSVLFVILLLGICIVHENSMADSARWEQMLQCQDGAVVIDVNTSDRRNLQVVVRDESLFPYFDAKLGYHQIKNANERIYRGQTVAGVFSSNDFVNVYAYEVTTVDGKRPGFEARKYEDRLVFRALDFEKTQCGGRIIGNDYSPCEVANYTFRHCR